MNRKYILINATALALTIAINYLSNTGLFNGQTMSSVSSLYENLFTPAGYAFSIWGFIYLGLAAFLVYMYQERNTGVSGAKLTWWFVLSCLTNIAWVIAWLHLYIGLTVLLMVFLLVCLLRIVTMLGMELENASLKKRLMLWLPFSIYSGWVSVALIANMAAWLTKIEWNGSGLDERAWTSIMIAIATLLNIIMMWKRRMTGFNVTGAWALTAIAVANWHTDKPVAIFALVCSGILMINLLVCLSFNHRKRVAL